MEILASYDRFSAPCWWRGYIVTDKADRITFVGLFGFLHEALPAGAVASFASLCRIIAGFRCPAASVRIC
jgi:hypothetical protein